MSGNGYRPTGHGTPVPHCVPGAISPEWGIKCAKRRSAHFLLKWPSKTFWLMGPSSLIRDGLQCLHLTSLRSVIGGRDEAVQPSLSVHNLPSLLPLGVGCGVRTPSDLSQKFKHLVVNFHVVTGCRISAPHPGKGCVEDIAKGRSPGEFGSNVHKVGGPSKTTSSSSVARRTHEWTRTCPSD